MLQEKTQLRPSAFDECAFVMPDLILLVYVDDMLLLGTKSKIQWVAKTLTKVFKTTASNINEEIDFLGASIMKDTAGNYILSQATYTEKILKKFNVPENCSERTPLPLDFHAYIQNLVKDPTLQYPEDEIRKFQVVLGSVGYLRATRFDILHAVNQLARFSLRPDPYFWKCMSQLLKYIQTTKNTTLLFHKHNTNLSTVVALTDAAFANTESRF